MDRNRMLDRALSGEPWDVLVIGGGATGLGAAVDSVSRGYRTLLVEQHDFAKGTSSRSTKLVHGGVRYLRQGNVALVIDALRERGRMIRNAPHLVRDLSFVVPVYDWWEGPFYGIGLKLYDLLAGRAGIAPSKILSREETLEEIPTLEPDGLRGGVRYRDAQFDDARMAIALARTAADLGGCLLNYCRVQDLAKENGLVRGAALVDVPNDRQFEVRARAVVNATGVFSDSIRRLDEPDAPPIMTASQGIHLVLDRSFLRSESAILVPSTSDGRVLFAVPWLDVVVVGTTDTATTRIDLEPRPLESEVSYLLEHIARYLTRDPRESDVLSVFAGLRPLVSSGEQETASISRDHTLVVSQSGLVTITGGKWTTYRAMAEDAIDSAADTGDLPERRSGTPELLIHGASEASDPDPYLAPYGFDAAAIRELISEQPGLGDAVHPDLPFPMALVAWGVRHEMAQTVEDILARRTRGLFMNAAASSEAAPRVAALMAVELGKDESWIREQVDDFRRLAATYRLPGAIRAD
ncbi:MAG TPA: FAD-dependent oxidoreductase [Rhodothermales bacterium]